MNQRRQLVGVRCRRGGRDRGRRGDRRDRRRSAVPDRGVGSVDLARRPRLRRLTPGPPGSTAAGGTAVRRQRQPAVQRRHLHPGPDRRAAAGCSGPTGATVARSDAFWESAEPARAGRRRAPLRLAVRRRGRRLAGDGRAALDADPRLHGAVGAVDRRPGPLAAILDRRLRGLRRRVRRPLRARGSVLARSTRASTPEPVQTFEIWNEPDNAQFWTPAPTPPNTPSCTSRRATRSMAADPSGRVLVGGLTSPGNFLPAMLAARPELRGHIDGDRDPPLRRSAGAAGQAPRGAGDDRGAGARAGAALRDRVRLDDAAAATPSTTRPSARGRGTSGRDARGARATSTAASRARCSTRGCRREQQPGRRPGLVRDQQPQRRHHARRGRVHRRLEGRSRAARRRCRCAAERPPQPARCAQRVALDALALAALERQRALAERCQGGLG